MEDEIDIKELIIALWRKKVIILIVTLIFFVIGMLLYGKNDKKEPVKIISKESNDNLELSYVETDFMLARGKKEELDGKVSSYKINVDAGVITNLNKFATSEKFLETILNDDMEEVKDNITIIGNGTSDIITLIVASKNSNDSINISNKILTELTDKVQKLYEINELVVIDGPRELEEEEIKEIEEKAQSDELIVEESKTNEISETENSGGSKKKVILVTAVGFVLACGIIVTLELFNSSVKNQEQLENATNLKTLVNIPKTNLDLSDKFQLLKVNVNECKTILVTSPENKVGKSFVSINLAKSFARSGKNVLLTNVEYLLSNKDKKDAKESDVKNLTILKLEENASEIDNINDSKIKEKLDNLENIYDIIIIDSKNILESAESLTVSKFAKYTILVALERKTKLENIVRAKNNIEDLGGNVIGNVLNNTAKK